MHLWMNIWRARRYLGAVGVRGTADRLRLGALRAEFLPSGQSQLSNNHLVDKNCFPLFHQRPLLGRNVREPIDSLSQFSMSQFSIGGNAVNYESAYLAALRRTIHAPLFVYVYVRSMKAAGHLPRAGRLGRLARAPGAQGLPISPCYATQGLLSAAADVTRALSPLIKPWSLLVSNGAVTGSGGWGRGPAESGGGGR